MLSILESIISLLILPILIDIRIKMTTLKQDIKSLDSKKNSS